MFTQTEQRAVFAILLHAALADGTQNDAERATLRNMTESFASSSEASFNPWTVYQAVLGGKLPVSVAALDLTSHEKRLLAYEMAVGVCDTDGQPKRPPKQSRLASHRANRPSPRRLRWSRRRTAPAWKNRS